jgi:uroporphyrinogen decarboxylase
MKTERLPHYEHGINDPFISKVLGENLSSNGLNSIELEVYCRKLIGFWKDMTYEPLNSKENLFFFDE